MQVRNIGHPDNLLAAVLHNDAHMIMRMLSFVTGLRISTVPTDFFCYCTCDDTAGYSIVCVFLVDDANIINDAAINAA